MIPAENPGVGWGLSARRVAQMRREGRWGGGYWKGTEGKRRDGQVADIDNIEYVASEDTSMTPLA